MLSLIFCLSSRIFPMYECTCHSIAGVKVEDVIINDKLVKDIHDNVKYHDLLSKGFLKNNISKSVIELSSEKNRAYFFIGKNKEILLKSTVYSDVIFKGNFTLIGMNKSEFTKKYHLITNKNIVEIHDTEYFTEIFLIFTNGKISCIKTSTRID